MRMPPLPADSIHARACKLKCEKILTRPWVAIWYAALQTVLIDLHLFRQHMTFIENAAVKTAAFSRLTTEIPQTDFCFNYLTGTPFQECPSFLFVPIQFSASQLISLEVAAISQTVAFSA